MAYCRIYSYFCHYNNSIQFIIIIIIIVVAVVVVSSAVGNDGIILYEWMKNEWMNEHSVLRCVTEKYVRNVEIQNADTKKHIFRIISEKENVFCFLFLNL